MPPLSRQESQERTRRRLRTAARREIAARGVGASSIDRIAGAAGFSRGAFYSNYASKRELLLELLTEDNAREIAVWQGLIEQATDFDRLMPELERRFDDYISRRELWLLGAELRLEAERDPEFGRIFETTNRQVLEKVRDLMAALVAKTDHEEALDAELLAITLRALSIGLMFADGPANSRSPGEAITAFLRGVLATGGGPKRP